MLSARQRRWDHLLNKPPCHLKRLRCKSSSCLSLCRESNSSGLNEPFLEAGVNGAKTVGLGLKWPNMGHTFLGSLAKDFGAREHPHLPSCVSSAAPESGRGAVALCVLGPLVPGKCVESFLSTGSFTDTDALCTNANIHSLCSARLCSMGQRAASIKRNFSL